MFWKWIPCALILPFAGAASAAAQAPAYQWVQYASGGLEARAIVESGGCPALALDGKPKPMAERAAPGPKYPMTVCALAIPAGVKSAAIAGKPLPLPKAAPDRILLVGDTGCRIAIDNVQNCNDADAWPFPKGAVVESRLKPDLVIHLGDFDYREAPCPLNNKGCYGSPFGDAWDVWRADFFEPAKPLLEAAPFVFVRGNHEECQRGGKGWSRTLDPYPTVSPDGCLKQGDPFYVDLGGVTLAVMDVASAAELRASTAQAEVYRKQFHDIAAKVPKGPLWLAFHRPIWASGVYVFGFNIGDNKTLALAARNDLPANAELMLSGHIHTFEILGYKENLPIQIISGNGGDDLHRTAPADPRGLTINGVTVAAGAGAPGMFGFAMLERRSDGWAVTNFDMTGRPVNECVTRGRQLTCD